MHISEEGLNVNTIKHLEGEREKHFLFTLINCHVLWSAWVMSNSGCRGCLPKYRQKGECYPKHAVLQIEYHVDKKKTLEMSLLVSLISKYLLMAWRTNINMIGVFDCWMSEWVDEWMNVCMNENTLRGWKPESKTASCSWFRECDWHYVL